MEFISEIQGFNIKINQHCKHYNSRIGGKTHIHLKTERLTTLALS